MSLENNHMWLIRLVPEHRDGQLAGGGASHLYGSIQITSHQVRRCTGRYLICLCCHGMVAFHTANASPSKSDIL